MESHLPRGLLAGKGIHGGSGAASPFHSPPTERAATGIPFRPSIAIIAVVITTMLSLTCLLLLYAKHCRRQGLAGPSGGSIGPAYGTAVERRSSGVGQAVVESLPVFRFGSLIGEKSGLECAVCLSRYETEELLRLLPKCRHAFHVDCVDAWLNFHSSCPICRSRVSPEDVLLLRGESDEPDAAPKPPGRRISGRHSSAGENSSGTGVRFAVRRPSESGAAAAAAGFDLERQRKDGLLLPAVQQNHRVLFHECEGAAQERWSDLRPSDLMLLRSGTTITSSGRFSAICTGDGRGLNWSRRSASAAIEERPFGEERTMRKWLWFTAKRTVRWIGGGQESGG